MKSFGAVRVELNRTEANGEVIIEDDPVRTRRKADENAIWLDWIESGG